MGPQAYAQAEFHAGGLDNPDQRIAEDVRSYVASALGLSLSLLSAMNYNCLPKIREQTMGINYGFEKVRFVAPVKSGAKVRGHFTMADARFRGASMLMITYDVSVEIEGERKPALTATWQTIIQFDPKDRPADA